MNRRVKGSFRWSNYDQPRLKKKENLAPRARFELATLRLTADAVKNLSALSGVACKKSGAMFLSLAAPNPAPKTCAVAPQREALMRPHTRARADPCDVS